MLAGHNVAFDVAFLKRLYRLAGVSYPDFYSHRLLDTASLGLFFILSGHLPSGVAKSDELFAYFQIPFDRDRRHSALGDARATAQLINAFLKMARDKNEK
jgi:DNA polymerase-3 subunit epsilon